MKKQAQIKFLHLIDHSGGTISKLVSPLLSYPEHHILTSFFNLDKTLDLVNDISKHKNISVVLHATGNKKLFYNQKVEIFQKFRKGYLFLHVSPNHFLIKNRLGELENIKKLVNQSSVDILTPSKAVSEEFSYYGIESNPIQLGVNFRPEEYRTIKKKDRKYITTVCTSEEGIYHYIKGIDKFYKLVKKLGLEDQAIILGNGSPLFKGIKSKRLNEENFIKYISKSKVYIQLSRTESYNLSAIYAKLLKVPVIVSNIEGHKDNIKYGFKTDNLAESNQILENILKNPQDPKTMKIVGKNYRDSIQRESLNNFRNSFNELGVTHES